MYPVFGLILIAIGISALIGINFFHLILPVILIVLGFALLSKRNNFGHSSFSSDTTSQDKEKEGADTLDEVYVFSGTKKRLPAHNFTGGRVIAVFGGAELDLRDVKAPAGKNISMEIVAVCGGIRLQVPENWSVTSSGMSAVLGGFDNRAQNDSEKAVKLLVRGASVFGGVEVSYE